MKVLLLRPDQAGDALKTLPVVRALFSEYPDQFSISMVCSRVNATLFTFERGVRVCENFDEPFDVVINLLADPNPSLPTLLAKISAKEKWSVPLSGFSDYFPIKLGNRKGLPESALIASILEQGLKLPRKLAYEKESGIPVLSEAELLESARLKKIKDGVWLGFCPFSSIKKRSFSTLSTVAIVKKINSLSVKQTFIFGTVEELASLKKISLPNVTFCSPTEFRSIGIWLQCLDGVFGVDTGPMHFAAAYGKPVLVFGRGVDVSRWYPSHDLRTRVVARGLFTPFPTAWGRSYAFRKWFARL